MSFAVVVPEPILDEIASWGLPPEVEETLFARLEADLEYGHETTCFRLAAPSPTYAYQLDLPHPDLAGVHFLFLFHLTYGPADDTLYVQYARHERVENWGEQEEGEEEEEPEA
jgi:hypothetical protein